MYISRSTIAGVLWTSGLLWAACCDKPVLAQEPAELNDLHLQIVGFFRNLGERNGPQRAFDELLVGSPLEENEEVARLVAQVSKFDEQYGPYVQAERVAAKVVGQDLILLTYLYKTERFPVIWRFAYYRPPRANGDQADWVVISLSFDTNLRMLNLTD